MVAGIDQESSRNSRESSREGDYNFPVFENPTDYTGEVDVIIDFSNHSNLPQLIAFSLVKKAAVVVATTGYTESQKQELYKLSSNVPVLHSANMSLGINVLAKVLRQMGGLLSESFDIEIIEKHHNKKIDAPSGTALYLANQINQSIGTTYRFSYGREGTNAKRNDKEIGIHAVRGGTIAGEHTVIFAGMDEVIELKHTAHSKNIFCHWSHKSG